MLQFSFAFLWSPGLFFCLARRALTRGGCACSRRERTGRQKSRAALCERCTHGRHTTLDVNVTDEPMHGKMGQFLPDAMVGVRAAGESAQEPTTKVMGRAVRALHTRPAHYAGRERD